MQNETSRKPNGDLESRVARLEATTAHLVEAVRELRADFRMMVGLQVATLGMVVTFGLAIIAKLYGGG